MAEDYTFDPWPAILSAFLVLLQVVLVMTPGVWYTRRSVVDTGTRRKLSIISFNLLLPANNLYHIGKNVSASTLVNYLPFAANAVMSNVFGMILGWLANWLAGTPRPLRHHVVAAAGFGNLNAMPLLIVSAICQHSSLPFQQILGDQCTSVGFGYVAVGTAATQIFTYPIAIWLLRKRGIYAQQMPSTLAEVVPAINPRRLHQPSPLPATPPPAMVVADTRNVEEKQKEGAWQPPDTTRRQADMQGVGNGSSTTAAAAAAAAAEAATAGAATRDAKPLLPVMQSFPLDLSGDASSDSGSEGAGIELASVHSSRSGDGGGSRRAGDWPAGTERTFTKHAMAADLAMQGSSTPPWAPRQTGGAVRALSPGSGPPPGEGADLEAAPQAADGSEPPHTAPLALEVVVAVPPHAAEPTAEPPHQPEPPPPPAWRTRAWRWARLTWTFTRENVLRMPCIGAGLGVIVGVITPIKDLLFPTAASDDLLQCGHAGSLLTATLGFLTGALFSVQAALIFVSSFVLGSVLAKGPGQGTRAVGWRPLLLVVLIRMVLLPALGCIVVVGFITAGWYSPLDPVYAFLLLQQFCVPTANQMQNIASMSGNREREMGALVFWQYCAAFVAIPAWMVAFLWLLDEYSLYPQA